MKRVPVKLDFSLFPRELLPLLQDAAVYDSSSSPAARVYFIDRDGGLYLKTAARGTLESEAVMTRFLHGHGLAPEVLSYLSLEQDWLLTAAVPGEDCTHPDYLADPLRLCDTTAILLRQLHELSPNRCAVPNRLDDYLTLAGQNYRAGWYNAALLPEPWRFSSAEEAWHTVETQAHLLRADTLIHGDYCLPNIMLKNWQFTGFIDLGGSGLSDLHIDLFWGCWSLAYNLKTNRFCQRFLDAYGADKYQPEMLRIVAATEAFG